MKVTLYIWALPNSDCTPPLTQPGTLEQLCQIAKSGDENDDDDYDDDDGYDEEDDDDDDEKE